MNGDRRPALTIEHELPGRLRIRLSHVLLDAERVRRLVAEHAGVGEVQYAAVSRSLLVRYDVNEISSEEIVIRIATGISLERDNQGVRVFMRPPTHELTDSAFYSGLALIAAFALRATGGYANARVALEWVAGLATAGAALDHGWTDYRLRGNIDPEVLAVTYLLTALVRGNALPAALDLGEQFRPPPGTGAGAEIVVRPVETGHDGVSPLIEVVVAPDPTPPDKVAFLAILPTLLFRAIAGDGLGRHANILEDIRRVADSHDQVLEGCQRLPARHPLAHPWNEKRSGGAVKAEPTKKEQLNSCRSLHSMSLDSSSGWASPPRDFIFTR